MVSILVQLKNLLFTRSKGNRKSGDAKRNNSFSLSFWMVYMSETSRWLSPFLIPSFYFFNALYWWLLLGFIYSTLAHPTCLGLKGFVVDLVQAGFNLCTASISGSAPNDC